MGDFLSKIESFLFDILGLVLPGVIFLLIIISPVSFIDTKKIPEKVLTSSYILSCLATFYKALEIYMAKNLNITLIILFIIAYLLGHTIKVFSIITYEFLSMIFDKSINKIVVYFFSIFIKILTWCSSYIISKPFKDTFIYKQVTTFLKPIKSTIIKIFTFDSPSFYSDNNSLKTASIAIINQKLNTSYPDVWYSVYKFSMILQQQENIKSLSANFLAKYNLYRSLSFIFIFTTIYYYCFFGAAAQYISPELTKITTLILYISLILWFTFHYKYKRYWTLCGNETLVSLYYFLHKKQLNT